MEDIKKDINSIRESQIRMEADVKHHIRRTDSLEELHIDNRRRIVALEEPQKAKKYLVGVLVDVGKFSGFVVTILAILRYFGKV